MYLHSVTSATDKIKHHVKLSDETPFKHKAGPIHPQDIEAVRKHPQEFLDAEIISQSHLTIRCWLFLCGKEGKTLHP